ncbi:MAG: aldehyde dehydrogenase family protein, partial [Candidatus Poseidoniaceae archaeon]
MKAFTALQHVLSALFIFVMATFWALPIVPALWVFHEVNAYGADATEWMGYLFTSIAAALAFGNTAVVKPSEQTPLALFRLVELLYE